MRYLKGTLYAFLAQESGQIQLLIIAPILALSFLSLIVRTASSAVDPALEKKKVTEQLKRRLSEVQSEEEIEPLQAIVSPKELELPSLPALQEEVSPSEDISPPILGESQTPVGPLQITRRIKKGETFASILKDEGLGSEEATRWSNAARSVKGLKNFRVGHSFTLVFSGIAENRTLTSVSYEIDKKTSLIFEKQKDKKIVSRRETLPTTLVWRAVGGRIQSSLYGAAKKSGVPVRLLDDLADMNWDMDLSSDLRPGDVFKVIFEEIQHEGRTIGHGKILAAEIVNRGKTYTLFSIIGKGGTSGTGSDSASRQFLRYPLKFSRISSVFTTGRFHPILKRSRPHLGVDFAAPAGTPVRSVAGGKVVYAGRFGGYGNFVRIDHPGPYASAYAHLQGIAKGVKVGGSVTRGQIIGYVGSTGLATGPHLHFELYKDGNYVNPLTAKLPMVDETPEAKKQNQFLAEAKKHLREQLSNLKVESQSVTLVRANPLGDKTFRSAEASPREPQRLALNTAKTPPRRKASVSRSQQPRSAKVQKRSSGRR
jgi:murein DD-endopeptidase MepM/ murein hydrolase activator NlpD